MSQGRLMPRASRRALGTTAATVLALGGLVLGAPVVATAAAAPGGPPPAGSVPPGQDPFYTAPASIASYQPGQIVATRPVTPPTISNVSAWQISYRSNDALNQPEMAVTTLLVPTPAWTGGGPRPVVSVQDAEDSTGLQCAPSYEIASGSTIDIAAFLANPLLAKGWAVAVPDFEGPRSEFMVGAQAGHAVLDGIRAVRNFGAGGVGPSNPWALYGYSGGAEATGWAAQLQPSYARGIRLAGAAMGGTPSDPAAVARYIDGGLFSGFEAAAAVSIITAFPDSGFQAILNAQGRADMQQAQGKCLTDLLAGFPFRKLSSDTTVPDPLDYPPVAAVLRQDTLGTAAPDTPVYDYHADTDEIVPVGQDNTLTSDWCALGATVQVVRDPVGEHAAEALARQGDVLTFLSDRFAGKPATSTC